MTDTLSMLEAFRRGDKAAAERVARAILAEDGDDPAALQVLGAIAAGRTDWATAIDCFARIAAEQPYNAGARFNHAEALRKSGDIEAAMRVLVETLAVAPDHVPSLVTLAQLLADTARHREALPLLDRAVAAAPRDTLARMARGRARLALGRGDGVDDFHVASTLAPDNAGLHLAIGQTLAAARRYEEADQALARATAMQPQRARVYRDRGKLAMLRHDVVAAAAHYRAALAHAPDDAEVHALLAQALHELREAQAAADHLAKALALRPDNATARLLDAQIRRSSGDTDGALAVLEALLADGIDPALRGEALAELGHCHDRLGDHTNAFRCFADANACVAADIPADDPMRSALPVRIAAMRGLGDAVFTPGTAPAPNDRPAPVFIVGFPRSGTTLIEQVLAAQGDFVTSDEAPLIGRLARQVGDGNPAAVARLSAGECAELRRAYWHGADRLFPALVDGNRFVDKQPWNLIALPLIARLFPDARILVMLRDPRDVCLSAFMQYFALDPATLQLLTLEDAAATYAGVMDLWLQWRERLPLPHLALHYEDLVRDFEPAARKVIGFLDAPWRDAILGFGAIARQRAISTPSRDAVGAPLSDRSIGRWRRYAAEMAPVLPTLAPYVARFGYEVE